MSDVNNLVDDGSRKWYISVNTLQYGPYTYTELVQIVKEGRMSASDPVWCPGMPGWVRADSIPGLFQTSTPNNTSLYPEVATEMSLYPEVATETSTVPDPHSEYTGTSGISRKKATGSRLLVPALSVLAAVIVFSAVFYITKSGRDNSSSDPGSVSSRNTSGTKAAQSGETVEKGVALIEDAFRTGNVELLNQRTHPQVRDKYAKAFTEHKSELQVVAALLSTRKLVSSDDDFAEYEVTDYKGSRYYIQFMKIDGIWYLCSL